MDFSVVVPFYNAEPYIARCIDALLAQSFAADRYEIIMVDNNSTDRSAEIARSYRRVSVLHESKQGSYAARNRGVAAACGNVIAFTDPDCVPRQDWLQRIAAEMDRPGVSLVLGDRRFALDRGMLGILASYESEIAAHIFSNQQTESYFAFTNNMAVRRSILERIGTFPEIQRGADSQLLRRAVAEYGSDIVRYVPEAVVTHLEIASVRDYLRKKRTYGGVHGGNSRLGVPQALPIGKRLSLAKRATERHRDSPVPWIPFLLVLGAGAIQFHWERLCRQA